MYSITFNNITSKNIGVEVVERPAIPNAVRNIEEQSIPGRNGSVFFDYGTYKNINISIKMNYKASPDEWNNKLSEIKRWLIGSGQLYMSDMQGWFYKVKKIELSECDRSSKNVGTFTATFTCDPFKYSDEGQTEINNPASLENEWEESEPIYVIEGNGMCTLSVNDESIVANIADNLTIDTSIPIAYRDSGIISNTSVTGDYDKLKLKPGTNYISVSSGFYLKVKPNWRMR